MRTSSIQRVSIVVGCIAILIALAFGVYSFCTNANRTAIQNTERSIERDDSVPPTDDATPLRVIAVGDIACSPNDIGNDGEDGRFGRCHMRAVADRAIGESADLYLGLGDQQYEEGSPEAFQNVFDRIWGSVKERFYPTPGNHEYNTPQARGYFDYFNSDREGQGRVGNRSEGWYRLDRPGWNIIVLNSNCDEVGGCGETDPQTLWLKEQLTTNPQPCTIVTFHHPRWTSGRYLGLDEQTDRSAAWWTVFQRNDVEIVLNGHDHLYERFGRLRADGSRIPKGSRAFTVGTGGKSLYELRDLQPQSDIVIDDQYGYLRLTLFQGSYRWEFVTEDGEILDQGSEKCF